MIGSKISSSLEKALKASASGVKAQNSRLLIISQNLANAGAQATTPGGPAYQRKTINFVTQKDRDGIELIAVGKIGRDQKTSPLVYNPDHPGANKDGYVAESNVNALFEIADARAAGITHAANLSAMQKILRMMQEGISLLKN